MKHVIVLAGGKGERLRPHTDSRPKPMVELLDKPILAYVVDWLASYQFEQITICCGYRHEVIVDYFGDGSAFGVDISYLIEDKPLGRGGALRRAMEQRESDSTDPVLAMNGDIITNLDPGAVIEHHQRSGVLATLVSVPLVSPYGIIDISETGLVSDFREKPELPFWINAGIYVLSAEMTNLLPQTGDHETSTFPELAERGMLSAFRTKAFWRAVDTIKDLTELTRELQRLAKD